MGLLFLVLGLGLGLGLAAAADKPSSDTRETFRVSIPVPRPRLEEDKIATFLDKIATLRKERKNALFVNHLEARKLNNLFMRYLQEKARNGYLRDMETAGSGLSPFRKLFNLFVRFLREYRTAAIIKQAVIQALKGDGNHPTKN